MAEPNNTLAQATNLGRILNSQTISDFVGTTDTNDFFTFNLGSRSSFNLTLNGLSADADVQLLDSTGGLITSSSNGGSLSESITQTLNTGNYAIRVFQFSGNTSYNLNLSASPFDFAGNSTAAARDIGPVGVQSFFQDAVTSSDTTDFYRLAINPNSSLSITLDNLAADADLSLLNASGTVIRSSSNGGTTADSISLSASEVRANGTTYFVRVNQFSGNTAYNLTINGSLPDLAGNSTATARDLGNLNGTQEFIDLVNSADTNDFYRFTVGPNSNLTARLDNLAANANLQILNATGTVIGSSSAGGTAADQVTLNNLAGGLYFARVLQSSGDTSYRLNLFATQPDFAGNTTGTALNFGTLNGTRVFNDEVRPGDINDFYRFDLTGGSTVNLTLNGLTADADLRLLNSVGTVIASSLGLGTIAESINTFLLAGTYFAQVSSFNNASTLYNLSLSSNLVPTVDLAGNTPGTARNIGPVGVQSFFRDRVSSTDSNDYYRFTINPNSGLNIVLNGLSADADLQLLRADGTTLVRSSSNSGTTEDTITLTAAEVRANGTEYVVRVNSFNGANTAYNLSINGSLPDVAGNSTGAARNLGNLNGRQEFIDFVNGADTNDFYQFTVGPNSNLTARLDNLAADADIEILNSAGTVIGSSRLSGNAADQVTLNNLAGGLYFARILRFGDTSYRLNLSATQPDFAGNTLATALNFGELNGSRTFNDDVTSTDLRDLYRFTIGNTSTLSVNLSGLTADADISLLDSAGTFIVGSSNAGTSPDFFTRSLTPGTYYVSVDRFSGDTLYNLRLVAA
ncbi:Peptidase [Trichormus variabilis ATCC 29413]|uniref:Peptidase n=2 Tax=Anabaena variabilis TaxID=264691 RepID=Q3MCM7_TRIV2|nr:MULTISPECIES: PPC domain-containing protein [Nostocaceae]ABA21259.1 Peptidase [Trichormus variabilis ATCC 29413]MBC1254170.1 PPC domain-containing protein [Trichormus variabilis V5]MBC1266326.1 PPC domain-containing protein [Trichormus variabilis FSR]MBC1301058.1 PPC domain-containing protein [Trichormus variabilis N2B]MBC1310787.1 PPC domain-containing protein [Trichormus variabilis PNB]